MSSLTVHCFLLEYCFNEVVYVLSCLVTSLELQVLLTLQCQELHMQEKCNLAFELIKHIRRHVKIFRDMLDVESLFSLMYECLPDNHTCMQSFQIVWTLIFLETT